MSDLRELEKQMTAAKTYEEWREAALNYDTVSGVDDWKQEDDSTLYDYETIRERLRALKTLRKRGDERGLLFTLNEGLHGNLGGMGKAALYAKPKIGTKNLVTLYVNEITACLHHIEKADNDIISEEEKKDFFHRASHCFGRSALMLSGAGALGPFHLGVIRALLKEGLLPRVISGSSAGAFMAGIIGTHTQEEITGFLENPVIDASQTVSSLGLPALLGWRKIMTAKDIRQLMEQWIPDVTFAEAFQISGQHINVSVAPSSATQSSRLLNAITSPNVLVREAILASCAVPGVFPSVMLMAKDARGDPQPYLPNMRWIDGSVTDDLPAKRLARLYGVNHFIASQTNPVVLWSIRDPDAQGSVFSGLFDLAEKATKEWLKATHSMTDRLTRALPRINSAINMFHTVALQEYTADINIIPRYLFWDPRKLLALATEKETLYLIEEGEAAAWPKIEMIRNCTAVSRVLDEILEKIDGDVVGLYRQAGQSLTCRVP